MMKLDVEWVFDLRNFRDWLLYPIPRSIPFKPQVVTATINRSLSRKREQESVPARLIHLI